MKTRLLFLVLGAAALPTASIAAQGSARRTLTHADVFLMKRVGAPALSPNGRWAVFSVTEPSYVETSQANDLWLVPTDGSAPPRRLTNTRGGESGVEWSPDGRRIAFSARREGDSASQVYVLGIAEGGEAIRVTNISTGASSPRWRPDGGAVLFNSTVYPGAGTDSANRVAAADRRGRKHNARVYESSPIRLWDRWLDDTKPSLFVQSLEPGSPARDILAGSRFIAATGFGGQLGNSGDAIAASWTPDGTGVVFAATSNRNEWTYRDVAQSLWLVSTAGGEPRRITSDSADYGSPRFSRDGKALYATMTPSNEWTFNNARLVAWSWPAAGPQRVVAGGADLSVGDWALSADGQSVFFLAETEGRSKLFRVASSGGAATEVGALRAGTYGGLKVEGSAASPAISATWESAISPAELGRIDVATGRWTALTRFNADRLAQIDWQPLREFWFTSSRGKRIHSFVALPPGFDSTRKYPLFLLIHGGPAAMSTDAFGIRWNYHLLASPGYVMVMTDYSGSTGYGEKFSQGIQFDPLAGPAAELNEAADEAIKRYSFVDASKQIAGGASYGGHLTNWLAVSSTRYRVLISHAGLWNLETQWATSDYTYGRERNVGGPPWKGDSLWRTQSPMRYAGNLRTPVLVSVGERDFRVPMNNALEFWTALQRQRVPSKLIVWPTENHWILNGENSRFFYSEVHEWIARWLRAPERVTRKNNESDISAIGARE